MFVENDLAVLHSCALGLEDIYVLHDGHALYFASLIEPLLPLVDGKLHTDWISWADIVALGYPTGSRTPFEEVKRIPFAAGWRVDGDNPPRPFHFEPFWVDARTDSPSQRELAELLESSIPQTVTTRPQVTLSGGWDSRLVAAVIRARSFRRPIAWTTSTDDGLDLDIELSVPVAESLGLDHRIFIPPRSSEVFIRSVKEVRRRTEFQTWMHAWIFPLAERIHRGWSRPLYDGLAGDVLIKSLYVGSEVLASASGQQWKQVWNNLTSGAGLGDDRIYASDASRFIGAQSERSFEDATRRLKGHPAEPTLNVLLTRTMRGIALSPRHLFGPECDVRLPFLDRSIIEAALAVPIEDKVSGKYYRLLLDSAAPTVAGLPSTNDPLDGVQAPARTRKTSRRSLQWMAQQVVRSPDARTLLSPALRRKLNDIEELRRVAQYSRPLRVLQSASLLSGWQSIYNDRLADEGDAPWV